jgi:FkbM family methyltransferase
MANLLKSLLKQTLFSGNSNLTSLNEPYSIIKKLLSSREITGIIDAGASNGRISRRFLRLFPNARIFAFEPNPLYKETLKQLAEKEPRFTPQFFALSDTRYTADLNITVSPGNTSLFSPNNNLREMYPLESEIKTVNKVETVTIDEWIGQENPPVIQVMKFDIQGGELKAMEGAKKVLQNSTLLIYTEVLFNPLYVGGAVYSEIDLFLQNMGFVLYDLFKPKYNKSGKLLWANAIFVHSGRMGL